MIATAQATGKPAQNLPSAIRLHHDLLYVANRGADTIAVFDLSLTRLAEVDCGGAWPRDLAVADDLIHVANQNSNTVTTFTAGRSPSPAGEPFRTGSPACILLR